MSTNRQIDRETLCGLIPHSEKMCLLDYVDDWNNDWIVCGSTTHRNNDNPLRRENSLSVVHAAEYGAQAMAVHGGLIQKNKRGRIQPGYLVSLRDVRFYVKYLHNIKGDIKVKAVRLVESTNSLMYEFAVFSEPFSHEWNSNDRKILTARATVMTETISDI